MKRVVALGLVTGLIVVGQLVAAPAYACACGAPAPTPGTEVNVDRETSIVRWDGGLEEIVMQLDMRSDAGETGLVVPTPNPATVTAGDGEIFDALATAIEPVEVIEWDWWGNGIGFGSTGGAPGDGAPQVLAQVQLGPIEATTLAADDAQGLTDWLDENGYALSAEVTAELAPYVTEGWSFVALKLTGELPFDGELDPIRFTFESDSLVYPMRLSRAADSPQTVRLYVLGDHRAVVTTIGGDDVAGQNTTIYASRPVDPAITALGEYLTVVDLYFGDPGSQITSDLGIADAPNDDEVIPTYTRTEVVQVAGIPVGPLVVTLVIMLIIGAIAILVRRRVG